MLPNQRTMPGQGNLEKGPKMNLEIHKPELVQRVNAHIQTGHFHDADEVLEKALDALDERDPPPRRRRGNRLGCTRGVAGIALSGCRPHAAPRAAQQRAGCRALMAWLLDTNILSEGRKPRPDPRVTAFYDREPLSELYISILSIAEIRFGIELQEDAARRAELNEWLTLTLRPTFAGRIYR